MKQAEKRKGNRKKRENKKCTKERILILKK